MTDLVISNIMTEKGKRILVINRNWCKGCRICVEFCPQDALAIDELEKAKLAYPEKCNECGMCQEVCEFNAIDNDLTIRRIDCEGCGVCAYFCPTKAIQLKDRHCGEWYRSETRFGPMVHARLGIAEANSGRLVRLIRKEARILAGKKRAAPSMNATTCVFG